MNVWIVLLISGSIGALSGAAIFFEPKEPYKVQIFFASTIKNILVGVLTGLTLDLDSTETWLQAVQGLRWGAFYGVAFGLVISLAKGELQSKDAPYVIPASAITGALIGLLLAIWAY